MTKPDNPHQLSSLEVHRAVLSVMKDSCSQYRLSENIPQVSILKHLQGFCRCAAGRGHILP